MKTFALLLISIVLAMGCKKPDGEPPLPTGSDRPGVDVGSRAADRIVVLGKHRPAKPTDPVLVRFDKFSVVRASFDPQKIEGGTATIELDLASLRSGSSERDDDLKSASYIDIGKFATATIEIASVKRKADKTFTADATVKLRGATKTYPVTFEVLEQSADSIRIKGEHTFSRLDFSIGTDPGTDPQQQVDLELTIQMLVTLKNS